jgi:GNAT superfamily N-acetyltransferase
MPFNLSTIRAATAGDAAAIAHLHAESWRSAYRDILTDDYLNNRAHADRLVVWQQRFAAAESKQSMHVMVAEGSKGLIGFVCLFPDQDPIWGSFLDNLHVAPGLTGQGIGRELLSEVGRYLIAHASRRGVYLWVLEGNRRALQFYERAGAAVVGSATNPMPDGQSISAVRCHWNAAKQLLLKPS